MGDCYCSDPCANITCAQLLLEKRVSSVTYDTIGEIITYTFILTNIGSITLECIQVSDDRLGPIGTVRVLFPCQNKTLTLSYVITFADIDNAAITNIARATVMYPHLCVSSNAVTITAIQNPAMTTTKTASTGTYNMVGQEIIYTYTIMNTGNITLKNITVTDDKLGTIPGTIPMLIPGVSAGLTATHNITQADLDFASITNQGTGTSTSPVLSVGSNIVTITAIQNPAITLAKTVNPTTYSNIGDILTYTYIVTNSGNITLPGPFTISDNKVIGPVLPILGPLIPGQSRGTTAMYTITASDTINVINIALATEVTRGVTAMASATATLIFTPSSVVLTSGTGAVPVPFGASLFDAFLVGGGGAGGGGNLDEEGAGGGGAGESIEISNKSLIGINMINYSIGTGGAGVTVPNNGNDGNPTMLTWGITGITALGGHGGFQSTAIASGDGGQGNNNGGGGGGFFDGIGGASNPGEDGKANGGNGGTGTFSNFNVIFSGSVGLGGTGGNFEGGGGGGVGAIDPSIGGGDPISIPSSGGAGGKGYGAGGGGSFNELSGYGGPGVAVINFHT